MKAVKCKNKQCGHTIALINGNVPALTCEKCGTVRKLHYPRKQKGFALTVRVG
jgi:hypothetical protein